jgi:hypothetical protein
MELVRGKSMRTFVGDPEVPVGRRLRWLVDVARALAAAHAAGLVHRDIKPDNVMIRDDGRVKVLDFGIARRQRAEVDASAPTENLDPDEAIHTLTEKGVIVGTPRYSAPEQLRCEAIDGRADQFSWGVTAYELLTGSSPWSADDVVGILSQILSGEVPPLRDKVAGVPAEVERVVHRTLAKRAVDRYPSIDEVADELAPFASVEGSVHGVDRDSTAQRTPAPETPGEIARTIRQDAGSSGGSAPRPWPVAAWVLAASCVLVVAVAGIAALRGGLWAGQAEPPSGASAHASPLLIQGLGCAAAETSGPNASPELARAIGIGACARLATGVGVDWNQPAPAPKLEVTAKLSAESAEVRLAVGDRHAVGRGATPIDAVVAAVDTLDEQLVAPPPSAEEIRAWGAKDAASARKIERVWRRLVLNVAPDDEAAIRELVQTDPDSPWPYLLAALSQLQGTKVFETAVPNALERLDKLPPARARGLRGALLFLRSAADRREGFTLLRQAYTEAPDDIDVAGIYAAVAVAMGAVDEGLAVADRLYARAPTKSLVPINNAITPEEDHDLDRDAKYLARLHAVFPESVAWQTSVAHLAYRGEFERARAAIAFGQQLGMASNATGSIALESARAWVELAAFEPKAVQQLAGSLLGDPRSNISTGGAELIVASHLLSARIVDGESALLREIERQRSSISPFIGSFYVIDLGRIRRWLDRPPPDAKLLDWVETSVDQNLRYSPAAAALVRGELALSRGRADPKNAKKLAEKMLEQIQGSAEAKSEGQRRLLDAILVSTVPLVRVARGDRAAAALWQSTGRAPYRRRRLAALDAGLALEAIGDGAGAEQAYRLAHDLVLIQADAFATLASMVKLADLYRRDGRGQQPEAQKLQATIDRLCAAADPGVLDAIRKLR